MNEVAKIKRKWIGRICCHCANTQNGRLKEEGGFNEDMTQFSDVKIFVDGIEVTEHKNQKSKSRKCAECGYKVDHFYTAKYSICPECNGEGTVPGKRGGNEGVPESDVEFECRECKGTGKIK